MGDPLLLFSLFGHGPGTRYSKDLGLEEVWCSEVNGIGQKIKYPNFKEAKVTMRKITFPPGSSTGWHRHGIPVFSYVLEGTLTVETRDNGTVQYRAGQGFAESLDVYHCGTNFEKEDLVVFVVYLGGDGRPLSVSRSER